MIVVHPVGIQIPQVTLEESHKLFDQGKLVGLFMMENEAYHAAPGISKSTLDNLADSPELFVWKSNNPEDLATALIIGSAYHNEIMKDRPFDSLFYLSKTQPTKPERDDLGRVPLSQANKDLVSAMGHAFMSDPLNAALLKDAIFEVASFWVEPETGVLCKSKEDILLPKQRIIVDLKSIASLKKIPWEAKDRRHHVKAAFALDGMGEAMRQSGVDYGFKSPDKFCLAYQEKTAPFRVRRKVLGPNSLVLGEKLYREDLNTYVSRIRLEDWRDMDKMFEEMEIPGAMSDWA